MWLLTLGQQLSCVLFRLFHEVNSNFLNVNWVVGRIEVWGFFFPLTLILQEKKENFIHVLVF